MHNYMIIEAYQGKHEMNTPTIERKESYNHRTTPLIEWRVWFNGRIVRECKTRKEALVWVSIYSN
jgi:hypothetical protein